MRRKPTQATGTVTITVDPHEASVIYGTLLSDLDTAVEDLQSIPTGQGLIAALNDTGGRFGPLLARLRWGDTEKPLDVTMRDAEWARIARDLMLEGADRILTQHTGDPVGDGPPALRAKASRVLVAVGIIEALGNVEPTEA